MFGFRLPNLSDESLEALRRAMVLGAEASQDTASRVLYRSVHSEQGQPGGRRNNLDM